MKNATSLGLPAGRHIWHQLGQSAWHAVCTVFVAALPATAFATVSPAIAAPPATVKLPPPQTDGGKPLMQALKHRHTSCVFLCLFLLLLFLFFLFWVVFGVFCFGF